MDWRIRRAIETMLRHMGQPMAVADLARRVNLSPSRFAHLFRRHTGRAPARYLRELRLDRARTLVEQSVLSIKEIMAQVGFNDPSHFARDFKRKHGMSPRMVAPRAIAEIQALESELPLSSTIGPRTVETANTPL